MQRLSVVDDALYPFGATFLVNTSALLHIYKNTNSVCVYTPFVCEKTAYIMGLRKYLIVNKVCYQFVVTLITNIGKR